MDTPRSYSQVGQDLWVLEKLAHLDPRRCSFLDIGCNHPVELSNTYALERLGWSGWLVDADQVCFDLCTAQRKGATVLADATKLRLASLPTIEGFSPLAVDYLSLDIDHGTLDALRNLLSQGLAFKVATVEHDAYRFGDELRAGERQLLTEAGYILEHADVGSPEWPFEDWWVHPSLGGLSYVSIRGTVTV